MTDPKGVVSIGSNLQPLTEARNPILDGTGAGTGLAGYETLTLCQALSIQEKITTMSVLVSSDQADGSLRTEDASSAYLCKSDLAYDQTADAFTNGSGAVHVDDGKDEFATSGGQKLSRGGRSRSGSRTSPRRSPTIS